MKLPDGFLGMIAITSLHDMGAVGHECHILCKAADRLKVGHRPILQPNRLVLQFALSIHR